MDYGVHLPLISFEGETFSLGRLLEYTETAERLGFRTLCANDHLVFPRPWLDGPTALASVLPRTGEMDLMTTVALPVVRGPVSLAKTLAAIDLLSGGRLIAGVGPGSSARDYASVDISFEERWKRLDGAVLALRTLWQKGTPAFKGRFYSTEGIELEPYPARQFGVPIWIGSWGSTVGLRRTARLGDGWLASAYNITPEGFRDAWGRLREYLGSVGREPDGFPNAVATMFLYVTEDLALADHILREVVGATVVRPADELRPRLLIGPAQECAEKLAAYQGVGVQRIFLWPVADELRQLETFWERVIPLVNS